MGAKLALVNHFEIRYLSDSFSFNSCLVIGTMVLFPNGDMARERGECEFQ